jgi:hypothetical protein
MKRVKRKATARTAAMTGKRPGSPIAPVDIVLCVYV